MDKVILFKGSKKVFNSLLEKHNVGDDYTPFMELIRQYNITVRANDISASQYITNDFNNTILENVVIYADDYASVTDHVITNFNNIVLLGHDIRNLYIQNPPKRIETSLKNGFGEVIQEKYSDYKEVSQSEALSLYNHICNSKIVGQEKAKKDVSIGVFKRAIFKEKSPLVILFYGPSGVGKTEVAKSISNYFEGLLTRIQFSMMQTNEAYNYIFGDVHGKNSLAKDLLARETNIVLIDEFDKVNANLYNVFYQMFDEGELEDINYSVDVSDCIFILTSNFLSDEEIANKLGTPIFSRIDMKIKFEDLTPLEIKHVIENEFEGVYHRLSKEQQTIIEEYGLLDIYLNNLESFKNIRMLENFIKQDVAEILFTNLIDQ